MDVRRWETGGERGLPKMEKLFSACRGLVVPACSFGDAAGMPGRRAAVCGQTHNTKETDSAWRSSEWVGAVGQTNLVESLILAQDQRWRRA